MNLEENRLQTFSDWPHGMNTNAEAIAKAGFFYDKFNRTLECYLCHLKISNQTNCEAIVSEHERLRPQCLFIADPTTSGNVPLISNAADLVDEAVRLQTFHNWPISQIVTPERLARAGFYSLHNSDLTKCAFCDGIVGSWEPGDNPDYEHKRYFPHCPFVLSHINRRCTEPLLEMLNNDLQNSRLPNINIVKEGNLAELGVLAHKGPKKPKFGTLEARLNSFATWPRDLIQTPDALAQAGFYYEGSGDQVRCFHCDGGLKYWDPHDEPWTEHARWFPYCAFVTLLKGQEFIAACAPELDPVTRKELQSTSSSTSSSGIQQQAPRQEEQQQEIRRHQPNRVLTNSNNNNNRRPIIKEITERVLQSHMLSTPARAALGVGLHVGRVKQAIKEKLERTGCGFSSGDALIEATLNLQHDEEDLDDATDDHQRNSMTSSSSSLMVDVGEIIAASLRDESRSRDEEQASAAAMASSLNVTDESADRCLQNNSSSSQKNGADAASASAPTSTGKVSTTLEEENRMLKEARLCKICMDHEVGIVFLPCGHLTTCLNCAPNLRDCPVCRCAIKATVRTFLS